MSEGILLSEATEEQIQQFSVKLHLALAKQLADQYGFKNPKFTVLSERGFDEKERFVC